MPISVNKQSVVFLLPVWGKNYIEDFLHFSLPSLLAPGNIPALCKKYECTLIFLTQQKELSSLEDHPRLSYLKAICNMDYIDISDLLFDGNCSLTLTLAYERGMRSFKEKMCSTYFFFLVSDYIMANNSLQNLIKYFDAGVDGITAGNFLVIEEYMAPLLRKRIHTSSSLCLSARELLSLSIPLMHPVSVAQTVTQTFTHAIHANRLFWKVSDQVLVGRFYLRHMLCIKPEIDDFRIGSFSDYAFIAEMCPSGNVAHIQDSDEYCVIEMAPFDYERRFIRCGEQPIQALARKLSEWTTHVHRTNAYIATVFHTIDLSHPPNETILSSLAYIQSVEKLLCQPSQPIYNHPYWISCIESLLYCLMSKKNKERYFYNGTFAGIIGSSSFSPSWKGRSDDYFLLTTSVSSPRQMKLKYKLRDALVGMPPNTSLWHMSWWDDLKLKYAAKQLFSNKQKIIVVAYEPQKEVVNWLENNYPNRCVYQYFDLMVRRESTELEELFSEVGTVLILLKEMHLFNLGYTVRTCAKFLNPNGKVVVYFGPQRALNAKKTKEHIAICLGDVSNAEIVCEKAEYHYNRTRIYFYKKYMGFTRKLLLPRKSLASRLKNLLGLGILACVSSILNLSLFKRKKGNKITSALLCFKPANPNACCGKKLHNKNFQC